MGVTAIYSPTSKVPLSDACVSSNSQSMPCNCSLSYASILSICHYVAVVRHVYVVRTCYRVVIVVCYTVTHYLQYRECNRVLRT